jgi:hypothetical protein
VRIFNGEPALLLQAVSAAFSLLLAFNVGLNAEAAGLWIAVITAVFAAITAWITRPVAPAVFTGIVGAVAALMAGYGYEVRPELIAGINALLLVILAPVIRVQITPAPPGVAA